MEIHKMAKEQKQDSGRKVGGFQLMVLKQPDNPKQNTAHIHIHALYSLSIIKFLTCQMKNIEL